LLGQQLALFRDGGGRTHDDVATSGHHRIPCAGQHFSLNIDARGRFQRLELPDDIQHRLNRHHGFDADGDLGFPAMGHLLYMMDGLLHHIHQLRNFLHQRPTRRGEDDALAGLFQQLGTHLLFQLADLIADGAGHAIEGIRCAFEGALFGNSLERNQRIPVEKCWPAHGMR
jgi:hypothetical protein